MYNPVSIYIMELNLIKNEIIEWDYTDTELPQKSYPLRAD